MTSPGNSELRRRLDEITSNPLEHHLDLLAQLCGHSIRFLEPSPIEYINCYAHALGINQEVAAFYMEMTRHRHATITYCFILFLLKKQVLVEIAESKARDEDLVLYYLENALCHGGRKRGKLVESKWGTGHIYEHEVFEVPLSFGDRVRYFRRLDARGVTDRFKQFGRVITGEVY